MAVNMDTWTEQEKAIYRQEKEAVEDLRAWMQNVFVGRTEEQGNALLEQVEDALVKLWNTGSGPFRTEIVHELLLLKVMGQENFTRLHIMLDAFEHECENLGDIP